jgi:hypothetical protein
VVSFFHWLQLINQTQSVGLESRFTPLLRKPEKNVPKSLIVD